VPQFLAETIIAWDLSRLSFCLRGIALLLGVWVCSWTRWPGDDPWPILGTDQLCPLDLIRFHFAIIVHREPALGLSHPRRWGAWNFRGLVGSEHKPSALIKEMPPFIALMGSAAA